MSTQDEVKQVTPQAQAEGGKGPILVIVLGVFVVAIALVLMMKGPDGPGAEGSAVAKEPEVTVAPKAEPKADAIAEPAAPAPKPVAPVVAPEQPEAKDSGKKAELEPLPLVLPDPAFAGTPKEVPKGINIDKKRLGKKRPPFMAPKGVKNVAYEKKVTSSDANPIIGDLDLVTDGDKEALDGSYVELTFGKQWVQIDLEQEYEISALVFWHRHTEAYIYRDVVVQVSNDPEFKKDVKTVFNNDNDDSSSFGKGDDYEYFESDEGELVDAKGVKARYVRMWSNGNTSDDQNHYTEVEVWALPGK